MSRSDSPLRHAASEDLILVASDRLRNIGASLEMSELFYEAFIVTGDLIVADLSAA